MLKNHLRLSAREVCVLKCRAIKNERLLMKQQHTHIQIQYRYGSVSILSGETEEISQSKHPCAPSIHVRKGNSQPSAAYCLSTDTPSFPQGRPYLLASLSIKTLSLSVLYGMVIACISSAWLHCLFVRSSHVVICSMNWIISLL